MKHPPYTKAHLNACSNKTPVAPRMYRHHLLCIHLAIEELQRGESPTELHWAELASMVNILVALKAQGHIDDTPADGYEFGIIEECVDELARAKLRAQAGANYRLTSAGLQAVKEATMAYEHIMANLNERAVKRAYNYVFNEQQADK